MQIQGSSVMHLVVPIGKNASIQRQRTVRHRSCSWAKICHAVSLSKPLGLSLAECSFELWDLMLRCRLWCWMAWFVEVSWSSQRVQQMAFCTARSCTIPCSKLSTLEQPLLSLTSSYVFFAVQTLTCYRQFRSSIPTWTTQTRPFPPSHRRIGRTYAGLPIPFIVPCSVLGTSCCSRLSQAVCK